MPSEKESTIFERFRIYMEDEMGPGKLITYGIASAGLFAALYRIRPFARFTKPSDVPLHFLQSRVPLQGAVMRVEPNNGGLLMIDHWSLLPFPHFNGKSYLPVKISGVNVQGNGISWLQSVVNGNGVTLVPLAREKEYLECIVSLQQNDQDTLNVGEKLIKLGFGTIHEPQEKLKNKHILAYKRSLANAQKWAIRRRNGYWHFAKQPTAVWKTQMFIINKMKSLLPTYVSRQLDL